MCWAVDGVSGPITIRLQSTHHRADATPRPSRAVIAGIRTPTAQNAIVGHSGAFLGASKIPNRKGRSTRSRPPWFGCERSERSGLRRRRHPSPPTRKGETLPSPAPLGFRAVRPAPKSIWISSNPHPAPASFRRRWQLRPQALWQWLPRLRAITSIPPNRAKPRTRSHIKTPYVWLPLIGRRLIRSPPYRTHRPTGLDAHHPPSTTPEIVVWITSDHSFRATRFRRRSFEI